MIRFGHGRARTAVVIIGALGLIGAYQGVSTGAAEPDSVAEALKSSRAQVEAINNIDDVPTVAQSLIPGTLEARDAAITRFQAAGASAAAGSKPEYAVVWAGKNNIGDMSGNDWMRFVGQGADQPDRPAQRRDQAVAGRSRRHGGGRRPEDQRRRDAERRLRQGRELRAGPAAVRCGG